LLNLFTPLGTVLEVSIGNSLGQAVTGVLDVWRRGVLARMAKWLVLKLFVQKIFCKQMLLGDFSRTAPIFD
jgi:hypothetical protein